MFSHSEGTVSRHNLTPTKVTLPGSRATSRWQIASVSEATVRSVGTATLQTIFHHLCTFGPRRLSHLWTSAQRSQSRHNNRAVSNTATTVTSICALRTQALSWCVIKFLFFWFEAAAGKSEQIGRMIKEQVRIWKSTVTAVDFLSDSQTPFNPKKVHMRRLDSNWVKARGPHHSV